MFNAAAPLTVSLLAKQVLNVEIAVSLALSFVRFGPPRHNLTPLSLSVAAAFISHRTILLSLSSAVINALRGPCSYSHTHTQVT